MFQTGIRVQFLQSYLWFHFQAYATVFRCLSAVNAISEWNLPVRSFALFIFPNFGEQTVVKRPVSRKLLVSQTSPCRNDKIEVSDNHFSHLGCQTYNGAQKNLGPCEKAFLVRTIFCSTLGSSRRPPTSPSNVVVKKSTHFPHFAPNSTLFGVGGEGSLVLVISLERSQHFLPPL